MQTRWQTGSSAGLLAVLLAALLSTLTACQTPPQTKQLLAAPPDIARDHTIAQVPFYPQQEFFCGPTTLSEVAGFYGFNKSPDNIAPATFTPGLAGTLQIEMAAATRQLGMVAYEQRATMSQLLSLVADDIPVIVLQNNSIAWLPQWHYAVVIGYDLKAKEVVLHTGVTEAHRLNFSTFERTWRRANYWMLAMLPPDKTSDQLDPFIYTKACQDLINTRQTATGIAALITATKQWPDYWLPYFLLGNHYFSSQPVTAAGWFEQGLGIAGQQLAYLNNYAVLLSELGCHNKATALIKQALQLAPNDNTLLDSQQQISTTQLTAAAAADCQIEYAK
ncbi:Peptidase_C39 like family protein [Arsukibacterium tuosuense]|uniref:Peptidase_C39 like family protein n=1 Tax=Arsukibacterium tuosuense TaxID=1323745 RepID=A0A285IP75_9GAMM|nr:PA2778 family cysteine peptidase [Arsukibacterium tuosuense]SNY49805.1 Peptidase_C39 like family protein [Arsukibacterium tuosuense]